METDPKECRVYAARCEELAKTADKPERARVLRNLSKQWIKLADELERAQRLLNDPRPSCGSHVKYSRFTRNRPVRQMPIIPFLNGHYFDPETKRIMGIAFEQTRIALGLTDRGDPANAVVAERIIELAMAGERNPDQLCERALLLLRGS
jgi:hypothetical protein